MIEKSQEKWSEIYSQEEIVQFVREISAYVGEVLVIHAGCKWEPLGTFWSTHLVIDGNVKVTKEGRSRFVPSVALHLGAIGAVALDMVSVLDFHVISRLPERKKEIGQRRVEKRQKMKDRRTAFRHSVRFPLGYFLD